MSSVEHPQHYNCHPSGIECIEVARHMDFNLGNVVKYVWRHGLKKPDNVGFTDKDILKKAIEDLEKAAWYLNDEIRMLREVKENEKKETLHQER